MSIASPPKSRSAVQPATPNLIGRVWREASRPFRARTWQKWGLTKSQTRQWLDFRPDLGTVEPEGLAFSAPPGRAIAPASRPDRRDRHTVRRHGHAHGAVQGPRAKNHHRRYLHLEPLAPFQPDALRAHRPHPLLSHADRPAGANQAGQKRLLRHLSRPRSFTSLSSTPFTPTRKPKKTSSGPNPSVPS